MELSSNLQTKPPCRILLGEVVWKTSRTLNLWFCHVKTWADALGMSSHLLCTVHFEHLSQVSAYLQLSRACCQDVDAAVDCRRVFDYSESQIHQWHAWRLADLRMVIIQKRQVNCVVWNGQQLNWQLQRWVKLVSWSLTRTEVLRSKRRP